MLAASNTYTGTTLISEGNLQVGLSDTGTTGLGNVTLSGSSAVLSGSGNIIAPITSIILGTLKPGDQGGAAIGGLHSQSMMFAPTSLATMAELQLTGSTRSSNLAFDTLHIAGDEYEGFVVLTPLKTVSGKALEITAAYSTSLRKITEYIPE